MLFHATSIIAENFTEHDVKFRITQNDSFSSIDAGFSVDGGPSVTTRFISRDNDNDVAIRVFGLVNSVPEQKVTAVTRACNQINKDLRYLKFYVDKDRDVNVEYDIPLRMSDSNLGEVCFEMFVRFMDIITKNYHTIAEALYGNAFD